MAIEKINQLKTVKAQLTEEVNAVNIDNIYEKSPKTKWILISVFSTLLLFLLIFMARVPYIGSYPDALFDYLFGQAKYIVYLLLILPLVSLIFNFKFKKIFISKRYILATSLIIITICIGISEIYAFTGIGHNLSFDQAFIQYHEKWVHYLNVISYNGFINAKISGGIIGVAITECFNIISFALLIVIAFLLFVYAVLILFNVKIKDSYAMLKFKKWFITRLGGTFDFEQFNEMRPKKHDSKIKRTSKEYIVQMAQNGSYDFPSIELLTDTQQNNFEANMEYAKKVEKNITNFLNKNNIPSIFIDINIMPIFAEVSYEVSEQEVIDQIIQLQEDISRECNLDSYNISYKGNVVKFEFINKNPSKVSYKSLMMLEVNNLKPLQMILGMNIDLKPFIYDLNQNPTALIIGRKGSGAAMLLANFIMACAYTNDPKELEIEIFAPLGDKALLFFNELPHLNGKVLESFEKIIHQLHEIKNEINDRTNYFNLTNSTTVAEYNSKRADDAIEYKTKLIVLSCFDQITKDSFQNLELIEYIISKGPKVGVYILLLATNANNESLSENIYNKVASKFILQLENEYESIRIFDNYRGIQLYGSGDCLYFDNIKNTKTRIQVCYLNQNELSNNINIIKTFYETKDEIKK